MRRIALFLIVVCTIPLMFSCGNNQKQGPVPSDKPVYTFTKDDTTEVFAQVNKFIEYLDSQNIRGAVEMLNFLSSGDSIQPLDPGQQRRQAMALMNVLGVRYKINRLTFRSNTNNEVKIDITLFDKPEGDPKPNMTGFYLRPVKFEGRWYLTVWDNITNTNEDSNKD